MPYALVVWSHLGVDLMGTRHSLDFCMREASILGDAACFSLDALQLLNRLL